MRDIIFRGKDFIGEWHFLWLYNTARTLMFGEVEKIIAILEEEDDEK